MVIVPAPGPCFGPDNNAVRSNMVLDTPDNPQLSSIQPHHVCSIHSFNLILCRT
jgi:hypothetical protein